MCKRLVGYDWNMPVMPTHFNFASDVVEGWAQRRPEGAALWWANERGDEKRYTFGEMAVELRKAAAVFAAQGIGPGDRVLVILPRIPQWWIAMLALIRLGAVPIPGMPLLTAGDIEYRIGAAEVRALVTDAEGATKVAGLVQPALRMVVGGKEKCGPGWIDFDEELAAAVELDNLPVTRADAPGLMYFTSGTTGHPKMVLHTQASYGLGHHDTGKYWLDGRPGDVHWNMSDTGWAKAAWSSLFGPWQTGACIFAMDIRGRFDALATLGVLERYPITTWCAAPTALRLIVREDLTRRSFRHLRHCVSAGEPLNPEVIALWKGATGLTIYEGYGQTESTCMIANRRDELGDAITPGCMGRAMPGYELAVLDAELRQVAEGCEGQLAVRVKPERPLGLFKEYWKNPEENAARFVGDYYLTGDMVRRDAEGWYWFVGRADDVIKSSGYRIGPFEVESALVEHPAVVEAAAVGKPDADRGQIVKAFVVLRKGVSGNEMLATELQEHCKRVTAPYKYPREIEFVSELPKTVSGKIRRVDLRRPV
jgi:acyl-coenzyme A synthetase/AMP-(fatty) acid ligase